MIRNDDNTAARPPEIGADTVAGIDLLRGAFAILVMVAHSWEISLKAFGGSIRPTRLVMALSMTVGRGSFWVTGFFVLSGFCIHLSVMNSEARGRWSVRDYFRARASRIYPLFLIGLLAAVGAWLAARSVGLWPGSVPPHPQWRQLLGSVFLLQGFTGQCFGYNQSWSITNEAVYYAAWPLALRVFGRNGARAALLASVTALVLTAAVVVIWKVFAGGSRTSVLVPFWTIAAGSVTWFAGAFMASVWNRLRASAKLERAVILACRSLWVVLPLTYVLQAWLSYNQSKAWLSYAASYLSTVAFVLLLLAVRDGIFGCKLPALRPLCARLGLLSYPLYLLHEQVAVFCIVILVCFRVSPGFVPGFLLLIAVCLVFITAFGVPLEVLILRWRTAWLGKLPTRVETEERAAAVR